MLMRSCFFVSVPTGVQSGSLRDIADVLVSAALFQKKAHSPATDTDFRPEKRLRSVALEISNNTVQTGIDLASAHPT